ncbi:hypothetical protein Tco_1042497 [Tanacetum coccineum]|uniref:BAH domain-containing protein n=1 Tax=Tanacetum coccineum TaxID=301880 RepID=A0ABQ5GLL1_9ASTR
MRVSLSHNPTHLTSLLSEMLPSHYGKKYLSASGGANPEASESDDGYICTVIEMFEGVDGILYFRAQWFYRAKDTLVFPSCATYPKHHKQKDAPDIYRLAAKTKGVFQQIIIHRANWTPLIEVKTAEHF